MGVRDKKREGEGRGEEIRQSRERGRRGKRRGGRGGKRREEGGKRVGGTGQVRGRRTVVDGGVCKSSAVKSKLKKIALVGKDHKQKDHIQGKEL